MAFPLIAAFEFVSKIVDRVIPDKQAQAAAQLELLKMHQTGELAELAAETDLAKGQMEINKIEAANSNLFVSGWRPMLGWTCGAIFMANYIGAPLLAWLSPLLDIPPPPRLEMGEVLPVLLGMLGLGGLRTAEKIKGAAR
jgi:hypothetical protein